MDNQRHFGSTAREAIIRTLMDDLDRTVQLIEHDIAAEEHRAGIFDRAAPMYPGLAGVLASRRDNLKVTIGALAQQLAEISKGRADVVGTRAESGRRPKRPALRKSRR